MTSIRERLIGIDTEYHTDGLGRIDRVFCLCATNAQGVVYKAWYDEVHPNALEDLKTFFCVTDPIFVCHAFEKAERRALKWLGVDVLQYSFICTWHLARMLQQTFRKPMKEVVESDSDKISLETKKKLSEEKALSYASLCRKYNLALIDTEHKTAMRTLCIMDTTEGHEQEILSYCAEDTAFLIPLLRHLFKEYYDVLKGSYCPLRPGFFDKITQEDALSRLVRQVEYIALFGDIADYGIPISLERVEKVQKNAFAYNNKLKSDFAEKYPGTYSLGKDGVWHGNMSKINEYLEVDLKRLGITSLYPKTASGKLSLSSDTLKEYFKGMDVFGEHFRKMSEITRQLANVAKIDGNPFKYIVNNCLWYESLFPYGTKTSRCKPSTKRYVFGWAKPLYCIIDPKPGTWLVELDFSSQETFVQCCICRDSVYNDIYQSKDIYLGFATKMKLLPKEDWEALPVGELKEKYHDVRKRVKSLVLGLSYGMGKAKLAQSLGVSECEAEQYVEQFREVVRTSTSYKERLMARLGGCNAFSLPDGFVCRSAQNRWENSATTIGNFPFQSAGGVILRVLVKELYRMIREGLKIQLVATIHDAIFFQCEEGDMHAIQKVSETMRTTANRVLAAPGGWTIRVGEPEIIRHGELWTPEHAYDEEAQAIFALDV